MSVVEDSIDNLTPVSAVDYLGCVLSKLDFRIAETVSVDV